MRKIVSHLIMTLDGVANFTAVADAIVRRRNDEVLSDFHARVAEEDAMLLGRNTYQEWADYWPTSDYQPFANHINDVTKYVASRTLGSAPWGDRDDATVLKGDVFDALTKLKSLPGRNIGIHGSPTLVESLLHGGLIDELRLEVYPILAGRGDRLFHADRSARKLRLLDSRTSSTGVVTLTYRPDGAID